MTLREPQGHPERGRGVKAVYGLYQDGQTAQQAVNRLRSAGIADSDTTIQSAQPMEDFEFGHRDKSTWMWWIACGGGLIGMASALGLSWLTEMSWPINVGGLPIFAWWPNLIITFELTMLGAILATVITLVATARLGRGSTIYDAEVSDGKILVGVVNPSESALAGLEAALTAPPGAELKKI
jgi:ActD protein